jgi:hypothetical protein
METPPRFALAVNELGGTENRRDPKGFRNPGFAVLLAD